MPNSEYLITGDTLSGIADEIRSKTGGSSPIAVNDFADEIAHIQGGYTTTINGVVVDRDLELDTVGINIMPPLSAPLSGLDTSNLKGCMGCERNENRDYYVCFKQVDANKEVPFFYVMENRYGVWSLYMQLTSDELPDIDNLVYARCFSINNELYISFHDSSTGVVILDCSNKVDTPTELYNSFNGDEPDHVSVHGCVAIGRDIDGTGVFLMLSSSDNHTKSYLFKISNHNIECLNTTYTLTKGEDILGGVTKFIPYIIYDTTTKGFSIFHNNSIFSAQCSNTSTNRYYAMSQYSEIKYGQTVVPVGFDSNNSKVYVLDVASKKVYSTYWNNDGGYFAINQSDGTGNYSEMGTNVMFCVLNRKKPFIFSMSSSGGFTTIPAKMINNLADLQNSTLSETVVALYEEV